MPTTRLEAFSDGVMAIIITIMVLELKVPHGQDLKAISAFAAGLSQLCLEFRLCRHLLEQPSSLCFTICKRAHRWHVVGQPASAVLAVADPVRHRLDG